MYHHQLKSHTCLETIQILILAIYGSGEMQTGSTRSERTLFICTVRPVSKNDDFKKENRLNMVGSDLEKIIWTFDLNIKARSG